MIEIVGAALVADGRVLLGLRAAHKTHAGCWDLVGGHMEVGETQWSALSREVMEELGIEILGGSYISSLTLPALPHRSAVMHVYSIHEWRGEPSLQNDEHAAINWFSLLDAGNLTNLALPEYPELFASLSAGTP